MVATTHASTAAILGFACVIAAASARANDSTAEIALDGLKLTKSDAISMDCEELYISRDRVRAKYRSARQGCPRHRPTAPQSARRRSRARPRLTTARSCVGPQIEA